MVRWRRGHRSRNIDDRRGQRRVGRMALPIGGGLGGGGLILLLLLTLCGGGGSAIGDVLGDLGQAPVQPRTAPAGGPDPQAEMVEFMGFVLDDVQATWQEIFAASELQYQETTLVLFQGQTQSGCGYAASQFGPHYCPADSNVYIDLDFFEELRSRFGAPGDFAQAYVLAHEVAHHVQNVTGISDEVRRLQQENPADRNELSVALELQADCFAGVWGFTAAERGLLEPGDLEEGLAAAAAVGDDRIQQQSGTQVNPESWTHGSSAQRVDWFRRGFETGDPSECDTL